MARLWLQPVLSFCAVQSNCVLDVFHDDKLLSSSGIEFQVTRLTHVMVGTTDDKLTALDRQRSHDGLGLTNGGTVLNSHVLPSVSRKLVERELCALALDGALGVGVDGEVTAGNVERVHITLVWLS